MINKYKIIAFSIVIFFNNACKTTQTQVTIPENQSVLVAYETNKNTFFTQPVRKDEVFRVFASSDGYEVKQTSAAKLIQLEEDLPGNESFAKDLEKYNKVNYKASAVLKLMLYQDSGKVSRIRFLRSSGISEIDKMIGNDLTRWRFIFADPKVISPIEFIITYQILLSNSLNKEDAVNLLKKYVDK